MEMEEKPLSKRLWAADHIIFTVKKERVMDACTQLTFSFLDSPVSHPRHWSYPQQMDLPSSIIPMKGITHKYAQSLSPG